MAITVSITVDGTERNDVILFDTVRKQDNLNSLTDTFQFGVDYYGTQTWRPTINSEVILTVDGTKEFGGIITDVKDKRKGHNILNYSVECKDFAHTLDRNLVTERYEAKTAQYILLDVITKYTTGFTTVDIGGSAETLDVITFNSVTVSECFSQLARQLNYSWYVDYDKGIHFFELNDELATFDLTDISGNYAYDSLTFTTDFTQLRNRIRIVGGETETNERTEYHSGTGTKDSFPLAYKFATLPGVDVATVAQDVGVDGIDDDADFDCMWNFTQKYMRFTSGSIPASGTDNVEITGIPLLPLNVIASDGTSISTYGVYEFKKEEKRLATRDDALAYAQAELATYKDPLREGSYITYTPGLRSGQTQNVNSNIRNIDEDFIIQRVELTLLSRDSVQYTVELATLKTLSLTQLLQELLRDKEVGTGDLDALFTFEQLTDTFGLTDAVSAAVEGSGPYYWAVATINGNEGTWNKSTWT